MSLTLRSAITAADTTIDVNGADALSEGDLLAIGSEILEVRAATIATVQAGVSPWQRLTVYRGRLGTDEAAHAAGASVTTATVGGGSALEVLDEGGSLDTAVTSLDFAGAGVTATAVGHAVTVTVPGGTSVLEDPGNVWEADTPVALGYRIAVAGVNLSFLVWEVTDAGTTDSGEPDWEAVPLATAPITDNDVEWTFQGYFGKVLGGALSIEAAADGGASGSSIITEDAVAGVAGDLYIRGGHAAAGEVGGRIGLQGGTSGTPSVPSGGRLYVDGGTADGEDGGDTRIYGGEAPSGFGGSAKLYGGQSAGHAFDIGYVQAMGAGPAAHGRVILHANNSSGTIGQVFVADDLGTGLWQDLVTVQAGTPVGGGYLTPLVFDSNAITGGLYAWTGADYTKIGLATA